MDKDLNQAFAKILHQMSALIEKYGWTVMSVLGTEEQPSYSYTVGLAAKDLPDLIMIGIDPEAARQILNDCVQKLLNKETHPVQHELVREVANLPLAFRLDETGSMLSLARSARRWAELDGKEGNVIQLVFPDLRGKFPWETGCDPKMSALQDPDNLLRLDKLNEDAADEANNLSNRLRQRH